MPPASAPSATRRATARARRLVALALLVVLAGPATGGAATAAEDPVEARFAALTPAQRVGQLFLVAFFGDPADPGAEGRALVTASGVGGLVLQRGNQVFRNARGGDLPAEIAALTADLQATALGPGGPGVPLFVAVDHEGDGDPYSHLREGFTALPSAMALGATWSPEAAQRVGQVAGGELAAVGVNVLLGPVLDVLADPRVDSGGDIGTRAFGGDPTWVGRLGAAYVRGVHAGAGGRVMTVAKHFPGHGGSDRLPDQEVATVNKSLTELQRIELPAFAAVTRGAPGPAAAGEVSEALMTSHIRYRGLQGNIYSVTRPISFDREGLALVLGLPGFPFAAWRAGGGLVVADSLGVPAIQRYFDPAGGRFSHREVARRALEAGNDVLILAQFAATPAWSAMRANVLDTLAYFTDEYGRDPTFRARVDASARRVLARKMALYPDWRLEAVAADAGSVAGHVGTEAARTEVGAIAAAAVTSLRQLDRPGSGDRLVIITDDAGRLACPAESCGLAPTEIAAIADAGPTMVTGALLARYGPQGTGALAAPDVRSATFCQVRAAFAPPLAGEPEAPAPDAVAAACAGPDSIAEIRADLEAADWLVFAFAELRPAELRDLTGFLLPAAAQLVQARGDARLAALSFGPPYYVDQTNFSQLDAYVAAYTKVPAAITAALEVLFGDRAPGGASPVTVEDADYDLTRTLEPDPGAPLPVRATRPASAPGGGLPARVTVEVGPVRDHNGHPVPDGTNVSVSTEPPAALVGGPAIVVPTSGGVARAQLEIGLGGRVEIHVASGGARASEPLVLDLARPTEQASASAATVPAPGRTDPLGAPDLLLALAAVLFVDGAAARSRMLRRLADQAQVRAMLLATCGGLSAYIAYGLAVVSGATSAGPLAGRPFGAALAALGGALVGLVLDRLTRSIRAAT